MGVGWMSDINSAIDRVGQSGKNLGAHEERVRVAGILSKWMRPQQVRLMAGELSAQEMRSVQAVVAAILTEVERGEA
jgi:hypothetical protein